VSIEEEAEIKKKFERKKWPKVIGSKEFVDR